MTHFHLKKGSVPMNGPVSTRNVTVEIPLDELAALRKENAAQATLLKRCLWLLRNHRFISYYEEKAALVTDIEAALEARRQREEAQ